MFSEISKSHGKYLILQVLLLIHKIMRKLSIHILLLVLVISSVSASCQKRKLRWMEYKETQCSDAWGSFETEDELVFAIEAYFFERGAPLKQLEFRNDSNLHVCAACGCFSGRIIEVQVHEDHQRVLIEHGFVHQDED